MIKKVNTCYMQLTEERPNDIKLNFTGEKKRFVGCVSWSECVLLLFFDRIQPKSPFHQNEKYIGCWPIHRQHYDTRTKIIFCLPLLFLL